MRRKLVMVLAGAITLTVAALVLGAVGGTANHPGGSSPYVSVLSDLSVRPAEAVPCNHKECFWWPAGNYTCESSPLRHCALFIPTSCTTLSCP